ncbi:unnamed protein product [Cylindrotheca closterium]|uniref:dolichol kinase n=1 Tax=Cylindrotheca closterium TaxID=2856 RepID=A0AAD2FTX9_9STRA|nr:unnamed protein product [Cylindrotheca closterium]
MKDRPYSIPKESAYRLTPTTAISNLKTQFLLYLVERSGEGPCGLDDYQMIWRCGKSLTTEGCLWAIVIVLLFAQRKPVSWAVLLTTMQYVIEVSLKGFHRKSHTTQSAKWRKGGDDGGLIQVALLASLFHSCRMADHYSDLAKLVTLVSSTNEVFVCISFMVAICLDHSLFTIHAAIFACTWLCLKALSRDRHDSLTKGESGVLVTLATILISETVMQIRGYASCTGISHELVALLGGAGCLATCVTLVIWRFPWWIRLQLHLVGPLVTIETGLAWRGYSPCFKDYLPRCLDWLVRFLVSLEGGYPRYFGLIYWLAVFVVAFVPTRLVLETTELAVVIRRKWFHAVAVILFSPVTKTFPQLMSLSYAIALCALAVLEDLRRDLPALQSFYLSFIDSRKDNPELIVSHMFLILGCAMPLWISEWEGTESVKLLLSHWGVLCLGIGDAAGAVVGTWYGKHRWGQNQRTIEGSLAMWTSITIAGIAFISVDKHLALFAASTIATLMEAFTFQMDNLVLPIIGSTVILLLQN